MGTFEKLGILVIVIIIVMILAVAIYQWGGSGMDEDIASIGPAQPLVIEREIESLNQNPTPAPDAPVNGEAAGTWPGGIPRTYAVQPGDKVWLLPDRWKLRVGFAKAIVAHL